MCVFYSKTRDQIGGLFVLPSRLLVVAYDNYIDALTFADGLESMRRDLQLATAKGDDETARHIRKVHDAL